MPHFEIQNRPAPAAASTSRRRNYARFVVLHNDLAGPHDALAELTAPSSTSAPHFYIAANGTITRLVSERRAAHHSGIAQWERRTRNIDLISIGIMLEHALASEAAPQLVALHWLLDALELFFGWEQAEILRWRGPQGQQPRGMLYPYALPPALQPQPQPTPRTLGDELVKPASRARTLGDEADPQSALRLWQFLQEHTYAQLGGSLNLGWAFHLHACKFDLGAPLAGVAKTPLVVGGTSYGYQVFARDTLYNEGRNYAAVQSLAKLITDVAHVDGLALALVKASYSASLASAAARAPARGTLDFRPDWRFHQVALQQHLGPSLSGNYATSGKYAVQVFAADTLFTQRSAPAGCQQLSAIPPTDPAYTPIWAETYAALGGTYDANAPLQQFAAANKLGAPLSMPLVKVFEGNSYTVQVFAFDTLYSAAGGPIKRLSALPKPDEVNRWQPAPATPAATSSPDANLLTNVQPSKTPERIQRLMTLATSLLGADAAGLAKYPQLRSTVTGGDVVCADLVTFCLSQIGVQLWGNVADPTGSGRTGRRAANYYRPDPVNQALLREVTNESTWLPGDILIYGIGNLSVDRAYHVNIYVGPFSYNGRACDVVNASQDMPDISAMTKEYCIQTHCWAGHYKWTRRVRVLELEREFAG